MVPTAPLLRALGEDVVLYRSGALSQAARAIVRVTNSRRSTPAGALGVTATTLQMPAGSLAQWDEADVRGQRMYVEDVEPLTDPGWEVYVMAPGEDPRA